MLLLIVIRHVKIIVIIVARDVVLKLWQIFLHLAWVIVAEMQLDKQLLRLSDKHQQEIKRQV
jgi:hypothetical protein